ncbi:hypothetical protein PM082_012516 [Marasmius tenuissimus]|nr:hypothetical protein PM082_012516 [Marasmius tenuissimus]
MFPFDFAGVVEVSAVGLNSIICQIGSGLWKRDSGVNLPEMSRRENRSVALGGALVVALCDSVVAGDGKGRVPAKTTVRGTTNSDAEILITSKRDSH